MNNVKLRTLGGQIHQMKKIVVEDRVANQMRNKI